MDENRIQNYLNLIQALLSCPNGEEPQILQANSDLVDLGFVQVCEAVAGQLAESGKQEELQKLLESMPKLSMQYQRQLRNLQAHYTTIKTNQINYQNYLQKFWQPGDISTWQEFGETTCRRYLDQIETYLSYIQPGKDLIGEFINTLRGLVEIEQVKSDRALEIREKERDRNLQTTIAVVGVGIGFAGVAATASPYLIKQIPDQNFTINPVHFQPSFGLNPPHNLTWSVLFSLGAGLVGVAIAAIIMGCIQKHEKSAIARIVNFILGNSQRQ